MSTAGNKTKTPKDEEENIFKDQMKSDGRGPAENQRLRRTSSAVNGGKQGIFHGMVAQTNEEKKTKNSGSGSTKKEERKKEIDELEQKYNEIMADIKNKKKVQIAKKKDGAAEPAVQTSYSYYSESDQPTDRDKLQSAKNTASKRTGRNQQADASARSKKSTGKNPKSATERTERSKGSGLTYPEKLGYTFKIPPTNLQKYHHYIDQLIFGKLRKDLLMEPIPPECGQLKFAIKRKISMMNKLAPSYYLYIEKKQGGSINILYGKKLALKK